MAVDSLVSSNETGEREWGPIKIREQIVTHQGSKATYRCCQWCGVSLSLRIVDQHENICGNNPVARRLVHIPGERFKSLGKSFVAKVPMPPPKGESPLRIVTFWPGNFLDGIDKPRPLLKDDAFRLMHLGIIVRDNRSLTHFRLRYSTVIGREADLLDAALHKAWKMGARL